MRDQDGFTLIELMITVGIIGILVSLSSTQYQRYQRKAKQAEAKLALGAQYALEKSFYAEYSAYIPSYDAIGYSPEGQKRWYYEYACINDSWAGSVTGYSGSTGTTVYNAVNNPLTPSWNYTGSCVIPNCSAWGSDPQSFTNTSLGQLNVGGIMDAWTIDQNKTLRNCASGI